MAIWQKTEQLLMEMVEHEERFVSQEMHNTLCQNLTSVSLLTQLAVKTKEAGKNVPLTDLKRIRTHLDAAREQSLVFMQPHILSVCPNELPQALRILAKTVTLRIECQFSSEGEISIPNATIAKFFFRVARESVHDIICHFQAKRVCITLRQTDAYLTLEIQHNGNHANIRNSAFTEEGILARFARHLGLQWVLDPPTNISLKIFWYPAGQPTDANSLQIATV